MMTSFMASASSYRLQRSTRFPDLEGLFIVVGLGIEDARYPLPMPAPTVS